MGVDQISKHDHSSDADGGDTISPQRVDAGALGIGGSTQATAGPLGDAGEGVIIASSTSAALNSATSSTGFEDVTSIADRTIAVYSGILDTNLGNYEITHGIYALELTGNGSGLEFRVGAAGDAPGTLESNSTFGVNGNVYRETHTFGVDPTQFGTWTPLPQLRSTDGNEVRVRGVHTVILSAEVQ